jgi:hypothetical protein
VKGARGDKEISMEEKIETKERANEVLYDMLGKAHFMADSFRAMHEADTEVSATSFDGMARLCFEMTDKLNDLSVYLNR